MKNVTINVPFILRLEYLTIFLSGARNKESWMHDSKTPVGLYDVKRVVAHIFSKLNIESYQSTDFNDPRYDYGVKYHRGTKTLCTFGKVRHSIAKVMDLKSDVFYAEINMSEIFNMKVNQVEVKEVSKFPSMRRDLSMVVDKKVKFEEVKNILDVIQKPFAEWILSTGINSIANKHILLRLPGKIAS